MVFIPPCVLCLALYLYYLLFSRNTRAFTFQKAFSAAPLGRFRYALSAKSGTVLSVMQCHRIPYWLPAINSFVVSAAFQKTYVAQKAPRSTLPLNPTISGRSRKAYVERGALFIGSAASRAFGVLWVCIGKPAASARNVTVSFRSYIANVASSEVYPT